MRNLMSVTIPDGYRVIERVSTMDILEARDLLLSKKKHNVTMAERHGDSATITRHSIECPFCRYQLPSYFRHLGKAAPISREAIKIWASEQYSLFENKPACNRLVFNNALLPSRIYCCPHCHQESAPSKNKGSIVNFSCGRGKLLVSCEVLDPKGVLSLNKYQAIKCETVRFPITERLEFNLRTGHTSVKVTDSENSMVFVLDVSSGEIDWHELTLYVLISKNELMRRKLYQAFSTIYRDLIPFAANELSPLNAVSLTRFKGFSRLFYDSIPYECGGRIESSFLPVIRRIRKVDDLPALLESSTLPRAKSLRRIMFENQGLFFYLNVLEKLWETTGDINIFTRLLESSNVFVFLSFLSLHPGAFALLQDYRTIKGATALCSLMAFPKWNSISSYAVQYSSLSDEAKKREQAKWKHYVIKSSLAVHQSISIPMAVGPGRIKDCSIGDYSFEWLRTKNDYITAGKELDNCLGDYSPYSNPVVAVRLNSKTVAAIEVSGDKVIQARGLKNKPIDDDEALFNAYSQWLDRYKLKQGSLSDAFMELNDDDLLF